MIIRKLASATIARVCNKRVLGVDGRFYSIYSPHTINTSDIKMPLHKTQGVMPDIKLGRKFLYNTILKPYTSPVNHPAVHNTIRMINDGFTWKKTDEEERLWKILKSNGIVDGCRSIQEIRERLTKQIELAKTLQREGFQSSDSFYSIPLRLQFAIGEEGEIIKVGDGQHRLGIAIALGIDEIPATLMAIHVNFIKNHF